MRTITGHHDGHGLAESLTILADDKDPNAGGASHRYEVLIDPPEGPGHGRPAQVALMQFQHGPRKDPASYPGILDSVLVAILLDRAHCFQSGPFRSIENDSVITGLECALQAMRRRADERASRNVLGRNEK